MAEPTAAASSWLLNPSTPDRRALTANDIPGRRCRPACSTATAAIVSISEEVIVQTLALTTPKVPATAAAMRRGSSPKIRIRPRGVSMRWESPFASSASRMFSVMMDMNRRFTVSLLRNISPYLIITASMRPHLPRGSLRRR